MEQNYETLDNLVNSLVAVEDKLEKQEAELAQKSQQFADYIEAQKQAKKDYEVLRSAIKEEMESLGLKTHTSGSLKLSLTPSGKYKAEDISIVPDDVCDIKKVLNNKKVKAYEALNGDLPEGVAAQGSILRITVQKG